ncbi:MAG: NAD(P)/FAD-dependent oxidoreductase [Bacteroidota bacterium]|nr:NAD(P)/FAD-dependent oxidoreductase [Bacteroidota bacterium]
MKEKIAIVGGGLSGSLLAICLAKKGFNVELYERRGDIRKGQADAGRSINLALSTRGIDALNKVGLAEKVLDDAIPMNGRLMHDVNGNVKYQPYGKQGQFINSVSRSGLNIKLLELADEYENVKLFFNTKCIDANLKNNSATLQNADGSTFEITADIIFGSDGAFSAIRSEMQKLNRFKYSQTYENYGYKELEIIPDSNGGFLIDKNALHIWPRGEFMMIALPNPEGSFTCTLFLAYEGKQSFANLNTKEQVAEFFNTYFKDAVALMPNLIDDFFANPTGSLATIRCNPWVHNRFALIGDAAHAVIPFYGQGMNCSFEDVKELDEIIDQHYPDWNKILDEYQKARIINANAIADLACKNFVEMRDLVGREDFMHFKKVEHELGEHYPELFKSQYSLVSFSTLPYSYALGQGYKNEALINHIIEHQLESSIDKPDVMLPIIDSFLG